MHASDEALLAQPFSSLLNSLPPRISSPLQRWAREKPQATALQDSFGHACSWSQLSGRVEQARQLLQDQGIGAGDRVLIVNENCLSLAVLILACSEIGAWSVVVNARMAPAELARIRSHCHPRASCFTLESQAAAEHWQAVADTSSARQVQLHDSPLGIQLDESSRPDAAAPADVCSLIYTTGTTGDPKGVMLTHRNLVYVAAITSVLRGMRGEDRIYGVLPVSHVFGLAAVFLASVYAGAELVLCDRFDPARTFQTLRSAAITGLFGVPTLYAKLLEHAAAQGITPEDLPRLKFMYSGGAPLDPRIKAEAQQLFGIPLLNAYGMTESGPTICQVRFNERPDSCTVGRPLPGLQVKVLDEHGQPVAPGEVGELHVQGPNIMPGYFRNAEATAAVLDAEGYLNTGDLVRFDEDGYMHIAGRSKELIIHSGFNVYPPEVEAVIARHPEVVLCAVIGGQAGSGDGDEIVVAYVQRLAGSQLDATALQDFIRPELAAYKRPGRIIFMDALPTAPSGKVLKHRLAGG